MDIVRNMDNPDIFLITSVINTGNKAWSYTSTRSVFSEEERFKQTIDTILSIRKLNDKSLIMLVECSDLDKKYESILKDSVDIFIQTYNNTDIRESCILTNKKGYGELMKSMFAIHYLIDNSIKFNKLIKISGRYWLNEKFNKEKLSNDLFVFNKPHKNSTCCPTVLYSVPYVQILTYLKALDECKALYENGDHGYEYILPPRCEPKLMLEIIGVSGRVAVDNTLYES